MAFQEFDPSGASRPRHADLGDRGDAVGDGGLHPPCGVGRVHVGFGRGKAQDHFLALGICSLTRFRIPSRMKNLLHVRAALAAPAVRPCGISAISRLRLEVSQAATGISRSIQVLLELKADGVALGVVDDGGPRRGPGAGGPIKRDLLTTVKV